MQAVEVLKQAVRPQKTFGAGDVKYFSWLFSSAILMAVALLYVWSHIYMTELEYQVARELSIQQELVVERDKLKMELATLRAPGRIEAIALGKLQMTYPEREQVIVIP